MSRFAKRLKETNFKGELSYLARIHHNQNQVYDFKQSSNQIALCVDTSLTKSEREKNQESIAIHP